MADNKIPGFQPAVINKMVKDWGQGTRKAMIVEIMKLPLPAKARLFNSVRVKLSKQGGVADRLKFEYFFYGFFWDFGSENLFGNSELSIPAHNWISKSINPRIDELAQNIAEYYGDTLAKSIKIQ